MTFVDSKKKFDESYGKSNILAKTFVSVDGKFLKDVLIKNKNGEWLEEYYKWQFIFSLINEGIYSKEYIGTEVYFPKGNKNSAPLKIDGCIFDDKEWSTYYSKWREHKDNNSVEWLRKHLIGVIEFKKSNGKDIKSVFTSQIKPAIKESEREYCIAFYYDNERLYIFQRKNGEIIRYDKSKNSVESKIVDLSLDLPDSYLSMPSFNDLILQTNPNMVIDRSSRTINDLQPITDVRRDQINFAMSNILKRLDKVSMINQRGYEILIQVLALKIYDEKRSEKYKEYLKFYSTNKEQDKLNLLFYITENEKNFVSLSDENIQTFIQRMRKLYNEAAKEYNIILKSVDTETINWQNENHIHAISSVVENLQDYTFIKSYRSDLYQLVFNQFANAFTKAEKGQFVTPLKIINFLVSIVNPRNGETIIDPTVGIADFLSVSFVNANGTLEDKDFYGVDNDEQMVMLAKLNMLLNGDGNAIIKHQPNHGSILYKYNTKKDLIPLDYKLHKNGNWDNWVDQTKLMKFNVVLTNPPFGEDRKIEPKNEKEREIMELYELWNIARAGSWIDPGLVFLENAYRVLDINGRIGIVLSNSITSVERWETARKWLMEKMRIVGLFDLPANVFADAGVNTTLLVAYKPSEKELAKINKEGYEIFVKEIKKVGYEVRSVKRIKQYHPLYKFDDKTFDVIIDEFGNAVLDEEFTETILEFRVWALRQEETLKKLFVGKK